MRYLTTFVLLVFLGAVAVFALQNTQSVKVNFLNWSLTAPVAFLTIGVYLIGMLSGWNVVTFLRRSLKQVTAEQPPTR